MVEGHSHKKLTQSILSKYIDSIPKNFVNYPLRLSHSTIQYDDDLIFLGKTYTRPSHNNTRSNLDKCYLLYDVNFDKKHFIDENGYDVAHPTSEQVAADVNKYGYLRTSCYDEVKLKRAAMCFHKTMSLYFMEKVKAISVKEAKIHLKDGTSAGWDFNMRGCLDKKDALLKYEGEIDSIMQELLTSVRSVGWFVSPKEELRPVEKLMLGKIRSFMSGPITLQILSNMLYYNFNKKLSDISKKHVEFPLFIGDTKFYRGWDRFYRHMSKYPKGFTGDISQCDSSLLADLLEIAYDCRNDFIERGDLTEEEFLYAKLNYKLNNFYSLIVSVFGDVILKDHGIPSGSGTTLQDNGFVIYLLHIYGWFDQDPWYNYNWEYSYYRFRELNCYKGNGDDSIVTSLDEQFDPQLLKGSFAKFGIVYNPTEYADLRDLEFLSTKFLYNKQYDCWAPLGNNKKILSSLIMSSKKSDKARWSWARANALRVESWPDKMLSKKIAAFISYLLQQQSDKMKSEDDLDNYFTYTTLLAQYKTDRELDALYYGVEGA